MGKGIYFASENAKSAGYVGRAGNIGIMFLSEVTSSFIFEDGLVGGRVVIDVYFT